MYTDIEIVRGPRILEQNYNILIDGSVIGQVCRQSMMGGRPWCYYAQGRCLGCCGSRAEAIDALVEAVA